MDAWRGKEGTNRWIAEEMSNGDDEEHCVHKIQPVHWHFTPPIGKIVLVR